MFYSIGQVAEILNISASTIRYYEKEGLLPFLERKSGIRKFSDSDVSMLKIIECLKNTRMPIKDIKKFSAWCLDGDNSLKERMELFQERREIVKQQMEDLQKTLDVIDYKCWYYETAYKAGTEDIHKHENVSDVV